MLVVGKLSGTTRSAGNLRRKGIVLLRYLATAQLVSQASYRADGPVNIETGVTLFTILKIRLFEACDRSGGFPGR